MLRRLAATIARITSATSPAAIELSQWDVYVQRCEQFPGLPLPPGDWLIASAPVQPAATDWAQSSIETFQPGVATLVSNSS